MGFQQNTLLSQCLGWTDLSMGTGRGHQQSPSRPRAGVAEGAERPRVKAGDP